MTGGADIGEWNTSWECRFESNRYDCEIGQKYMFETTLDAGLQTMRRSEVGGAAIRQALRIFVR